MAEVPIRRLLLVLALAAPALAACDRLRFDVTNDTAEPVRVDFKFVEGPSTCRTPGFFGDSVDLAAGRHFPFVCPSREIAYVSLTQHGRTCALYRDELARLGHLTASSCLSAHPVRAR